MVQPKIWYGYGASPDASRSWAPAARRRWAGPVYRYDAGEPVGDQVPAVLRRGALLLRVGPQLRQEVHFDSAGQRWSRSTRSCPVSSSTSRWTCGSAGRLALPAGVGHQLRRRQQRLRALPDRLHPGWPVARSPRPRGTPTSGLAPLTVQFSSAGHARPRRRRHAQLPVGLRRRQARSTAANPSHTYTANGNYTAQLKVTDNTGRSTGSANVPITVGNTAPDGHHRLARPTAACSTSATRSPYKITRHRPRGRRDRLGGIDCSRVAGRGDPGPRRPRSPDAAADRLRGHHSVLSPTAGTARRRPHHYVLEATLHRQRGSPVTARSLPMRGRGSAVLQPKRKQAEHHDQDGTIRHEAASRSAGRRREHRLPQRRHCR